MSSCDRVGGANGLFVSLIAQMLPLSTNIRDAYKNGQDDEQNFIQNLALFLCTFLKEHAAIIEQKVREGPYGRDYVCVCVCACVHVCIYVYLCVVCDHEIIFPL